MARRMNRGEIEVGDFAAEKDRAIDEFGEEFVQARLKDFLDLTVAQPGVSFAGETMTLAALAAIGFGNEIEIARDLVVARDQRAWHLAPQQQQLRDQPRLQPIVIDPVVGPSAETERRIDCH